MQPHERGGAKSEEVLSLTPSSKKPASLYFAVVEGALCRLHQMGASVILDSLASSRDVLDSAVPGFSWTHLCAALQRHFPGGKGRFSLVECKS